MSEHRREKQRQVAYAVLYPRLVPVAKKHGYALALHGSMVRDLDVIAIPWVAKPSTHVELAAAIAKKLDAFKPSKFTKRFHGRLACVITIPDVFFNDSKPFYFDLSVMHTHRITGSEEQ